MFGMEHNHVTYIWGTYVTYWHELKLLTQKNKTKTWAQVLLLSSRLMRKKLETKNLSNHPHTRALAPSATLVSDWLVNRTLVSIIFYNILHDQKMAELTCNGNVIVAVSQVDHVLPYWKVKIHVNKWLILDSATVASLV